MAPVLPIKRPQTNGHTRSYAGDVVSHPPPMSHRHTNVLGYPFPLCDLLGLAPTGTTAAKYFQDVTRPAQASLLV